MLSLHSLVPPTRTWCFGILVLAVASCGGNTLEQASSSAGSAGTLPISAGAAGAPSYDSPNCILPHSQIGCPDTYEAAVTGAAQGCNSPEPELLGQCTGGGLLTYHHGHDGGLDCGYDPTTHVLRAERSCQGYGPTACCHSAEEEPYETCLGERAVSACPVPDENAAAGASGAGGAPLSSSAGSAGALSDGGTSGGSPVWGDPNCIIPHSQIGCPDTYEAVLDHSVYACNYEYQTLGQCSGGGLLTYHYGHDGGADCGYDPTTHALRAERYCEFPGRIGCCHSAEEEPYETCDGDDAVPACAAAGGAAAAAGATADSTEPAGGNGGAAGRP